MLKKLTKAQEARLPEMVKEGIKIGSSCKSFTYAEACDIMEDVYEEILGKPFEDVKVIVEPSPKAAWEKIKELMTGVKDMDFVYPYIDGQLSQDYFSFIDAFIEFGVEFEPNLLKKYKIYRRTNVLGFVYPFDDVCIISQTPSKIIRDNDGKLHCETGPALAFEDGHQEFYLNGVKVPAWLVTTDKDSLDPKLIYKKNYKGFNHTVEIRSEIIKKIGPKKLMKALKFKLIEKISGEEFFKNNPVKNYSQQGDVLIIPKEGLSTVPVDSATMIRLRNKVFYELYETKIEGGIIKALRMGNPSLDGEEHIEFVSEDCETVFEAYIFRNFEGLKMLYPKISSYKELIKKGFACLPYQLS